MRNAAVSAAGPARVSLRCARRGEDEKGGGGPLERTGGGGSEEGGDGGKYSFISGEQILRIHIFVTDATVNGRRGIYKREKKEERMRTGTRLVCGKLHDRRERPAANAVPSLPP